MKKPDRPVHRSKNPAAIAHLPESGKGGRGIKRVEVRRAVDVEGIGPEGGAALWIDPADGGGNAGVLGAARVSAEPAAGAARSSIRISG
jgi:hypothetical protein